MQTAQVIPDTTAYLLLGLGVTALVMMAIIGRIWLRWMDLRNDEAVLHDLDV
jgi:hypothetical protein